MTSAILGGKAKIFFEKKFEKDLEERKKVVPLQSRSETTGFFAA